MIVAGWILVTFGLGIAVYAYVVYPLMVWALGGIRRAASPSPQAFATDGEYPEITVILPVFNEERVIAGTLNAILAADYPKDRMSILVVSDASTDGTDDIVRSYADRGVGLLRLGERGGKTAAENAVREHVQGTIVVNTDASVRIAPDSLKRLIAALADPEVGVASGRDVSVSHVEETANIGEATYVGYEMWVRRQETRVGGIVGASGCFFATRRELTARSYQAR